MTALALLLSSLSLTAPCHAGRYYPDRSCSPGEVDRTATVAQICQPGYATSHRHVTYQTKLLVRRRYGIAAHDHSVVIDHGVPLELGGTNSLANLWPEPIKASYQKDTVEDALHEAVCSHRIGLKHAQYLSLWRWHVIWKRSHP